MVAAKYSNFNYMDLIQSSIRSNKNNLFVNVNNKESLKEMVKYLTKLNKEKIIDENQYEELITLVCANFIENEVKLRIEKNFNNKLMFFFNKI